MVRIMYVDREDGRKLAKEVASINGFPHVISKVNRLKPKPTVWQITLSGTDDDVAGFEDELKSMGIE